MMTQPEQRIALAEWMGWEHQDATSETGDVDFWYNDELKVQDYLSPNYPNDLNACHEVEKKLKEQSLCEKYGGTLGLLVEREEAKHECWEAHATTALMLYCFCIATSQQRTEALCRTLFPERFE